MFAAVPSFKLTCKHTALSVLGGEGWPADSMTYDIASTMPLRPIMSILLCTPSPLLQSRLTCIQRVGDAAVTERSA